MISLRDYREIVLSTHNLEALGRDRALRELRGAVTRVVDRAHNDCTRVFAFSHAVMMTNAIDDRFPLPRAAAIKLAKELLHLAESTSPIGSFLLIQAAMRISSRLRDRALRSLCRSRLNEIVEHAQSHAKTVRIWLREVESAEQKRRRRPATAKDQQVRE